MTYDFFADKADKLEILRFIFKETDLHIYDAYSPYDQNISQYKTIDEIASKFDLDKGGQSSVTFQMWSPRHKGKPIFRKIDLDPRYKQTTQLSIRDKWLGTNSIILWWYRKRRAEPFPYRTF